MRKALLLVFVTTLLTLGLSANSVVYAQTDFTDCAACHGTITDFTTPPVDKTSTCIKCHYQPYHSLTILGWPVETAPYGWFMSDPLLYSSTTIHAAHDGSNKYSQPPYDLYGCAVCHKTADCSSCHSSVPHQPHSASTYVSPTLTVCDGTSWYSTGVSCAKSLCHSQLPTIVSQPVCTNCHPVGGHGDVTALHVSPQLTQDCISSNCHSSSSLNIEHENRGYDCFTCHNNPDPTRAATLRNAIDSHNTNCSACHTVHGDITQIHTATNMGTTYRGYECIKCHITDVIPEHDAKPSSSTYGKSCSTCHPSPRNTLTPWDKSCIQGGCHTATTGPGSFHTEDTLKHASASADCTSCHQSDVSIIHQTTVANNSTTSCGVSNLYGGCHTSPDEVPTVKRCETCHPDRTPTNHGYNAAQHTATNAGSSCTICHSLEMKPEHMDKYGYTCKTCHPTPRDKVGIWDKTCNQICHQQTIHAEQSTLHQSSTTDCTSCHGTDVGTLHSNCGYCHSQSKIPTTTDCYSCHLDKTADHFKATCNLCHSDKTYARTGLYETHKKHPDKVLCGGCHKVYSTTPARMCIVCHAGSKSYRNDPSGIRDLHKMHVGKMGLARDACQWCHGKDVPTSFSKLGSGFYTTTTSCRLCHSDKSATSTTLYAYCSKHKSKVACEGCHRSGFDKPKPITEACKVCHSYKSASIESIHEKHIGKAWCSTCHQVNIPVPGKDCSKCHGRSMTYQNYSTHYRHAGEKFMCMSCHGLIGPTPPPPPAKGTITGTVKDTSGAPISGATISTDKGGYSATSDYYGGYTLTVVPDTYVATASKTGYQSASKSVTVGSDQTVTCNFALSKTEVSSNLALGKPAYASSVRGTYHPRYAVDGDISTMWCSNSDRYEWIYVDLGSKMRVSKVVLKWASQYGKRYKIEISNDGKNWSKKYETDRGDGGTDTITFSGTDTRYVRMYGVEAAAYYFSLLEFEIY